MLTTGRIFPPKTFLGEMRMSSSHLQRDPMKADFCSSHGGLEALTLGSWISTPGKGGTPSPYPLSCTAVSPNEIFPAPKATGSCTWSHLHSHTPALTLSPCQGPPALLPLPGIERAKISSFHLDEGGLPLSRGSHIKLVRNLSRSPGPR